MDSDRRHELEQNTLAQALTKAPSLLWEYGSYLLLAVAIVLALYFFFRTRNTSAIQQREAESASLYNMTTAVEGAREIRQLAADPRFAAFLEPEDIATRQAEVVAEFQQFADLPATSERPGVRAHAARLRGDLAWTLATFPALPTNPSPTTQPTTAPSTQATTRPATRPSLDQVLAGGAVDTRSPEEWLHEAETAYREVVEKYPTHTADNLAALFGLAAVAEQKGDFDAAAGYYDQLIERQDIGEGAKTLARQRKALAGTLSVNPLLAPPRPATQPSTGPTTGPSTTRPGVGEVDTGPADFAPPPSTAPATQPVE